MLRRRWHKAKNLTPRNNIAKTWNMGIRTIIKLLFEWDTFLGLIGSIGMVVLPFIKVITPFLQFVGVILGLVLVIYSIKHKRMEIRKLNGQTNDTRTNK